MKTEIESNYDFPSIDNKYKIHNVLGTGYSAKVLLASYINTLEKVAIKVYIPKYQTNFVDEFNKEMAILKQIEHPNLLKLIEYDEGTYNDPDDIPKEILYSVFELYENGDLFDFIQASKGLGEVIIRYIFKDLINAIKFLHQKKIVHRDLKLENLFLDKNFNVVIGDFGFARLRKDDELFKTKVGTIGYQSPEFLENHLYDGEANDIFALGIILFTMYVGGPPISQATRSNIRYKYIVNENYDEFWKSIKKADKNNTNFSENFKILINGMLSYKNRWTIEQIEKSAWFQGNTCPNNDYHKVLKGNKTEVEKIKEKFDLELEIFELPEYLKVDNNNKVYRDDDEDELFMEGLINKLKNMGAEQLESRKW